MFLNNVNDLVLRVGIIKTECQENILSDHSQYQHSRNQSNSVITSNVSEQKLNQ